MRKIIKPSIIFIFIFLSLGFYIVRTSLNKDRNHFDLIEAPELSNEELEFIKSLEEDYKNGNARNEETVGSRSSALSHNFNNSKLIVDQEIANLSLIGSYPDYGNILNKSLTKLKMRTINNEECELFGNAAAGILIPLPTYIGTQTTGGGKILTVDEEWNRIILMDRGIANGNPNNPVAISYPQFPVYNLARPTDIKNMGRIAPAITDTVEKIFIAENNGNKIVKLDYHMIWYYNSNDDRYYYYDSKIQDSSYTVLRNCFRPYSLAVHSGENGNPFYTADDVIWYSENYPGNSKLVHINANTGAIIQQFDQLAISSVNFADVNPGRISTHRSPDGQRNLLAFVDETVNKLFVLKLNTDGSYTDHPDNIIYMQDFGIIKLKSVLLQSMNNGIKDVTIWTVGDGGSGGCSGGLNCGDVSTLVVKYIGNTPAKVEYLATYWSGVNSPSSFVNIQNIYGLNGTVDLFTIEKWTDDFGLRRYKPGVDVITDGITSYCYPAEYATYTVKLTNPAKVKFTAQYRPANGQYSSIDIYINSTCNPNPVLSLPSGTSQLTVRRVSPNCNSNTPNSMNRDEYNMTGHGSGQYSMTEPERIKLKAEFIPLDEGFGSGNSLYIEREKTADFNSCNSGGGCPYLYTYTVGLEEETPDPYVQDNNLLHRSEFDQNIDKDIEDKYILNVTPTYNISEEGYLFKIKELDNDHSYFDRFKLTAIDHPFGTKLGITEYGDYVLYFPDITCSPDYAEHNGDDVTDILTYDSAAVELVNGEEDDEVNASFCEGEYRLSSRKAAIDIFKNSLFFYNVKGLSRSDLIDSMAVIMDPSENDQIPIPNPVKRPAGVVRAYDTQGLFSSGDIEFARRQNRSAIIIPVGQDINIDSVEIDWGKDFGISYLTTTPVFYGGYTELEMDLISAVNSDDMDLTDNVKNSSDDSYAEMDNSTEITLKFAEANEPVQAGWVRDYVFTTNGRYIKDGGGTNVSNAPGYDESLSIPKEYRLHQNFPNPFNPFTTIKYDLPKEGNVIIKIYDLLGRELLRQAEFKSAGYHEYQFNGFNFSSGVYFYRIETTGFVDTKRMVLLK